MNERTFQHSVEKQGIHELIVLGETRKFGFAFFRRIQPGAVLTVILITNKCLILNRLLGEFTGMQSSILRAICKL